MARMNRWIITYRPNSSARMRLFCCPYAGGAANVFRTWPDRLPPETEVCAVELPGRWTRLREPPIASMSSLVEAAVAGLAPGLDRPFALFGHSLGALIAFEIARQLRRTGGPSPTCLIVAGCHAPQVSTTHRPLYQLPTDEFLRVMNERYGGIPRAVLEDSELLRVILPAMRADIEAFETYSYSQEPPLDLPICAFGGLADTLAPPPSVHAWCHQTSVSFTSHMFHGGHFFFHDTEREFFEVLSSELGRIA